MFTGIIQETAKLKAIKSNNKNFTFILNSKTLYKKKDLGTSIAINGVCLTLTKVINKKNLFFDISPETLKITNLKYNKVGDFFNLERSLKYGDEIAGHFVQGHIDDVGKVLSLSKDKNSWICWITFSKKYKKYLVKKGSITVNGISLTINDVKNNTFRINIIPHTFKKTIFSKIKKNDFLNLEYDLLLKFLK